MLKLIALVLPLALDTFAVAAALGVARLSASQRLRVSLVLAGFEAGMPLIGVSVGQALGHAVGSPDRQLRQLRAPGAARGAAHQVT